MKYRSPPGQEGHEGLGTTDLHGKGESMSEIHIINGGRWLWTAEELEELEQAEENKTQEKVDEIDESVVMV